MSGCAAQSTQIDKEKEVVRLDAETDRGSGRGKREDRTIPHAAICALSVSPACGVTHTHTHAASSLH